MRLLRPGVAIALSLTLLALNATATVKHSIGIARNADETVRYIEHHQYLQDGRHEVRYYDADNQLVLFKEIRYPELPQHPIISQADFLRAMTTTVEQDKDTATITRSSPDDAESFSFELNDDIIIEAGFDAYVRANFQQLQRQRTAAFKFAVPGQTRLLGMKLTYIGREENLFRFTIEPKNWVVRLLVSGIDLYYDGDAKLVRYQGFSNLKPPAGESREVQIDFRHYESEQSLDSPLAEWLPGAQRG